MQLNMAFANPKQIHLKDETLTKNTSTYVVKTWGFFCGNKEAWAVLESLMGEQ